MKITFSPLTLDSWNEFELLFGPKGACAGCWCMTWRLSSAVFKKQQGDENKKALKKLVKSNAKIGVIAYVNGQAVAWCAVAPRECYTRLERSRVLKQVDDLPVWSVSCFFIQKSFRNRGLSVKLIKAAVAYAKQGGATIIEAYPQDTVKGKMPDVFAWTGIASAFTKAGFQEVCRRSPTRPIMRYYL